MKLAAMPWNAWSGMDRLLLALDADAGDTRIVGGAVRDTLLGLAVSDVDLATRHAPDEVIRRLETTGIKAVPTGLAHGTVTAVVDGRAVEVTTLRRDVATDGRHATVAFTDDWREDAARRDFTINALYADPGTGEVFDYFGGREDIAVPRVRFIGDPLSRIAEDHLRILRFFRFHARFGRGAPDPAGLDACAARANDLMALSRERIAGELLKLLALADPGPTVALLVERTILAPVLREIGLEGVSRLGMLIARERDAQIDADAIRRLAALLPPDPQVAEAVAQRLRLSKNDRRRLTLAADRAGWRGGSAFQRSHGVGKAAALDRLLLGDDPVALVKDHHRTLSSRPLPTLPLKGSDLIALGLPPGPAVSSVLAGVAARYVDEDFPGTVRAHDIAREMVAQALRSSQ